MDYFGKGRNVTLRSCRLQDSNPCTFQTLYSHITPPTELNRQVDHIASAVNCERHSQHSFGKEISSFL